MLYIKTYGCQMNVYDSGRMSDVLAASGFVSVDAPDDADLVILNTCHIRERAAEKVYSDLGRLKLLKSRKEKRGGRMVLAVAGCVAQAEAGEIFARAPQVEVVVGPQAYHRLPGMVERAFRGERRVLDTEFPAEAKFDRLPADRAAGTASAFLTVQEGCDKFCTFCVVPYTRGAEYSRPADSVLAEAGRLAEGGVRELTLLGQNVNNYHGLGCDGGEWRLARLIARLAGIEGIERIRYTTSYPADVDETLIAAHRDIPKLMPYLHLPVQSGSDRVLAAMRRRHTAADYLGLVERLRAARPDIGLSSDFIVGFPGETEADFEQTLGLVRQVGFVEAYAFKYSPRPGTPAAARADQVEDPVKGERLARLQALLRDQQRDFNAACVGRTMPVLIERKGRHAGQLVGRSPYMQPVHAHLPEDCLGAVVPLRIATVHPNSLAGVPLAGPHPGVHAPSSGAPA